MSERHGIVIPLPGGIRAKCFGPGMCEVCNREVDELVSGLGSPDKLIDAFNACLRLEYERGQPENFIHAIHQFVTDYERWRASRRPNDGEEKKGVHE